MNRIVAVLLCFVFVVNMSGCGKIEVKEYKTEHESGKTELSDVIDNIDEFMYKERASVEEVAKSIDDFCIYENGDGYEACFDFDTPGGLAYGGMKLKFNADKEFTRWEMPIIGPLAPSEGNKYARIDYDFMYLRDWINKSLSEEPSVSEGMSYCFWDKGTSRLILNKDTLNSDTHDNVAYLELTYFIK